MSKDLARRSMDRRNFLKGTALVAGGAAVAGLAGCAPASQSAEGAGAIAAWITGSPAATSRLQAREKGRQTRPRRFHRTWE